MHLLPTYVGTYKFAVPLCVQNIIMRMLLGHSGLGIIERIGLCREVLTLSGLGFGGWSCA